MPKKKEQTTEEVPEIVSNTSAKPTEFIVTDASGLTVRTYSVAVHGETAEELAQEFANKFKLTVK